MHSCARLHAPALPGWVIKRGQRQFTDDRPNHTHQRTAGIVVANVRSSALVAHSQFHQLKAAFCGTARCATFACIEAKEMEVATRQDPKDDPEPA